MGLDMFLTRKTYIWKNLKDQPQLVVEYPNIKADRVRYIEEQVGYWRKANAIHQWFVEHVQDNVDECQESYLEPSTLEELLATIKKVQEDKKLAPGLLPTQAGFFFGDTDYGEYYFEDLDSTVTILETVLSEDNTQASLYYRASW